MKYIAAIGIVLAAPCLADRPLSEHERASVASAVSSQMKDPDSTQFRWLPVSEKGEPLYCGLYNAKNSFGGYVGFRPFVVRLPNAERANAEVVQIDTTTPRYGRKGIAEATCGLNGYVLSSATPYSETDAAPPALEPSKHSQ